MDRKRTHNPDETSGFRNYLRSRLTPAEAFLWKHLKSRKFKGRRFTRQHGIGPYIVDFYCASERLIIELDGEVHNNPAAEGYDEQRTKYLSELGYVVIRFENKWVFERFQAVMDEISDNFNP